jgi:hypothetical protein
LSCVLTIFVGPDEILLDADSEVQEEHIGEIAGLMSEWEGRIADGLGLSKHDRECIKNDKERYFNLQM